MTSDALRRGQPGRFRTKTVIASSKEGEGGEKKKKRKRRGGPMTALSLEGKLPVSGWTIAGHCWRGKEGKKKKGGERRKTVTSQCYPHDHPLV